MRFLLSISNMLARVIFEFRRKRAVAAAQRQSGGDWKLEWRYTPDIYAQQIARKIVDNNYLVGLSDTEIEKILGSPIERNPAPSTHSALWFVGNRDSSAPDMFAYEEFLVVNYGGGQTALNAAIINLA